MILLAYLPEVVAFSVFFLMSLQLPEFGTVSILAQIGATGLLILSRPADALQTLVRWWPLLLVPVLAMLSTFWSDLPEASLRYGAQYLFTAFVGVHLARLMSPQRFLIVLLLAAFVFIVLSLGSPRMGPSFHHSVPIGLTGSKNAMGTQAMLTASVAFAALLMPNISRAVRWIAALALLIGFYFLVRAESATALVTGLVMIMALAGLWYLQRLPANGRLSLLLVGLIILVPLSFLLPEALAWVERFMTDTLDKDPTLTGRTILWAAADELAARRPFLGYGYQAIWLGDSPDSTGLHRLTGMTDGRTFHFHNHYRQIAVDLGYVGMTLFAGTMLVVLLAGIRQFVLRPSVATTFFFLTMLSLALRGSIDLIVGPFAVQTLVFYAAGVYAFKRAKEPVTAARPAPAQPRRWRASA
ncbi:MAG: O-antigen ligase family protein [Hyphomonadaceae bacterium]|nr:O-antigen ligase family protein [Hyphomonadaceae bacterium]